MLSADGTETSERGEGVAVALRGEGEQWCDCSTRNSSATVSRSERIRAAAIRVAIASTTRSLAIARLSTLPRRSVGVVRDAQLSFTALVVLVRVHSVCLLSPDAPVSIARTITQSSRAFLPFFEPQWSCTALPSAALARIARL